MTDLPDDYCPADRCALLRNPRDKTHLKQVPHEKALAMIYVDHASHHFNSHHNIPDHVEHRTLDELHAAVPEVAKRAKRRALRRARRELEEEDEAELADACGHITGAMPKQCVADPMTSGQTNYGACDGSTIAVFTGELGAAISKMNPASIITAIAEGQVTKAIGCKLTGVVCRFSGLLCWLAFWPSLVEKCQEKAQDACDVRQTICKEIDKMSMGNIVNMVWEKTKKVVHDTFSKPGQIINDLTKACAGPIDSVKSFLGHLWPHPSWWPGLGLSISFGVDLFVISASLTFGFGIGNDWKYDIFGSFDGNMMKLSDWAMPQSFKEAAKNIKASFSVGIDFAISIWGAGCLAGWGNGGSLIWEQNFPVPWGPLLITGMQFGINAGLACDTKEQALENQLLYERVSLQKGLFEAAGMSPLSQLQTASKVLMDTGDSHRRFLDGFGSLPTINGCTLCTLSISVTALWSPIGPLEAVAEAFSLLSYLPSYDQNAGYCQSFLGCKAGGFFEDCKAQGPIGAAEVAAASTKSPDSTKKDIETAREKLTGGLGLTDEQCIKQRGKCPPGQAEVKSDAATICMSCRSVNCGGDFKMANKCENCQKGSCYSADCMLKGGKCVDRDDVCGKYNGIQHPSITSKCCANTCGSYCGAPNCNAKSADNCCGGKIPDARRCSDEINAPCTLSATTNGDCPMSNDEQIFVLFQDIPSSTCPGAQAEWKICNNEKDPNFQKMMVNCPVTCAKALNKPCPTTMNCDAASFKIQPNSGGSCKDDTYTGCYTECCRVQDTDCKASSKSRGEWGDCIRERGCPSCKYDDFHISCGFTGVFGGGNCGKGCDNYPGCHDECCAWQKRYCKENQKCMTDRKCEANWQPPTSMMLEEAAAAPDTLPQASSGAPGTSPQQPAAPGGAPPQQPAGAAATTCTIPDGYLSECKNQHISIMDSCSISKKCPSDSQWSTDFEFICTSQGVWQCKTKEMKLSDNDPSMECKNTPPPGAAAIDTGAAAAKVPAAVAPQQASPAAPGAPSGVQAAVSSSVKDRAEVGSPQKTSNLNLNVFVLGSLLTILLIISAKMLFHNRSGDKVELLLADENLDTAFLQ